MNRQYQYGCPFKNKFGVGAIVSVLMSLVVSVTAQESFNSLASGTILVWSREGEVWQIDPITKEKMLYFSFQPQYGDVFDAAMIGNQQRFLVLERENFGEGLVLGNSSIVEVNSLNGVERVLFEQANIFDIEVAQDGQHALLSYFPSDLKRVSMGELWITCVLNIQAGDCVELASVGYGSEWVSSSHLIWTDFNMQSYLIDIHQFDYRTIPATVLDFVTMPLNPDEVLFSRHDDHPGLYTLNLTTLEISAYEPDAALRHMEFAPLELRISPNNRYLMYRDALKTTIVDFQTGEVIKLSDIQSIGWLSGDTFVATTYPDFPAQFIRYSVSTNQLEIVEDFEVNMFVILVQ